MGAIFSSLSPHAPTPIKKLDNITKKTASESAQNPLSRIDEQFTYIVFNVYIIASSLQVLAKGFRTFHHGTINGMHLLLVGY